MDKEIKRFLYAVALIGGTLLIAFLFKGTSSQENTYQGGKEFTVSELLEEKPIDKNVIVTGNVTEIMSDYKSKKGYIYQRFMISDGKNEIMIFCSAYKGRKDLNTGDKINVEGRFQKFKEKYEIYTYCSQIEIV